MTKDMRSILMISLFVFILYVAMSNRPIILNEDGPRRGPTIPESFVDVDKSKTADDVNGTQVDKDSELRSGKKENGYTKDRINQIINYNNLLLEELKQSKDGSGSDSGKDTTSPPCKEECQRCARCRSKADGCPCFKTPCSCANVPIMDPVTNQVEPNDACPLSVMSKLASKSSPCDV